MKHSAEKNTWFTALTVFVALCSLIAAIIMITVGSIYLDINKISPTYCYVLIGLGILSLLVSCISCVFGFFGTVQMYIDCASVA